MKGVGERDGVASGSGSHLGGEASGKGGCADVSRAARRASVSLRMSRSRAELSAAARLFSARAPSSLRE